MNVRSSSSEKGGTSSTASGEKSAEPTSQILLRRIKENVFNTNLIQVVNDNFNIYFGLKDLLKKVYVLSVFGEVSQVLIVGAS